MKSAKILPMTIKNSPSTRTLGTLDAITLTVSSMVGAGIFTIFALTVKTAGVEALWAWVFIVLLSFPMAITFSDLTGMLAESGGPYVFLRDHVNKRLGLFVAWSFWLSALGAATALLTALIHMLMQMEIPDATLIGLSIMAILVLITSRGIHVGMMVSRILTASTMLLLLLSIVLGISHGFWHLIHTPGSSESHRLSQMLVPASGKPIWLATFYAFWTYSGWEAVAVTSGSYKSSLSLGRGMLIGSTLVGLLYILVAFAAIWALPTHLITTKANPLVLLGDEFNPWLGLAIAWGAIAVVASSLLSWIISTAALTQSLLRDGLLFAPQKIRTFKGEFHRLIPLLIGLIVTVIALMPFFSEAIAASSLTALIPYAIVFIAVSFHKTADWDGVIKHPFLRRKMALFAAITALLLTVFSGIQNLIPTLVLLTIGGLLVFIRKI